MRMHSWPVPGKLAVASLRHRSTHIKSRSECKRLSFIMYNNWPAAGHEFSSILCLDCAGGENAVCRRQSASSFSFGRLLFKTTDIKYSTQERAPSLPWHGTKDLLCFRWARSSVSSGHTKCVQIVTESPRMRLSNRKRKNQEEKTHFAEKRRTECVLLHFFVRRLESADGWRGAFNDSMQGSAVLVRAYFANPSIFIKASGYRKVVRELLKSLPAWGFSSSSSSSAVSFNMKLPAYLPTRYEYLIATAASSVCSTEGK